MRSILNFVKFSLKVSMDDFNSLGRSESPKNNTAEGGKIGRDRGDNPCQINNSKPTL